MTAEQAQWKRIETAPRDCGVILRAAYPGHNVHPNGSGLTDCYHCWWDDFTCAWARWPHPFPPSHWLAIPAFPKEHDMTPRPSHPKIEVGMQAALDVTRPMQPYQKHALTRALAMHMPDAAELLFALLDVETSLPGSEDFDANLDELDKIVDAYLALGWEIAEEARGSDPYDYRYQERREATDQ